MPSRSILQILGEMTSTGDVPPVLVGTNRALPVIGAKPSRRSFLKKRAKPSTVHEEQSLIPQDATVVDDTDTLTNSNNDEEQPVVGVDDVDEPLLGTDLAIIAPDATPNATAPISATAVTINAPVSQVPEVQTTSQSSGDSGALDTILQKSAKSYESIGGQRVTAPRLQETAPSFNVTAPTLPAGMGVLSGARSSTDLLHGSGSMPEPSQGGMTSAQRTAATFAMYR